MFGQSLTQKVFGSGQITVLAAKELNRIPIAIDRAIRVQLLAFDLDCVSSRFHFLVTWASCD
jgi:hypothetical protein